MSQALVSGKSDCKSPRTHYGLTRMYISDVLMSWFRLSPNEIIEIGIFNGVGRCSCYLESVEHAETPFFGVATAKHDADDAVHLQHAMRARDNVSSVTAWRTMW